MLRVRLLGDVAVRVDSENVPAFASPRLQLLLAFLVLHRAAPQARERMAYVLWPESTDGQARTNLRKLLHTLRGALPDLERYLAIDSRALQWRGDAQAEVDVVAFEDALDRAERTTEPADAREHLERAVSEYGGALLPAAYEDWVLAERDRLHAHAVAALERLSCLEDDDRAALRHGERLLRLEPLHEATFRRLMRLHARRGERAAALRLYHVCESTLERELGVEPSEPTRTLYEALVRGRGETAPAAPGRVAPTAPLVGREEEWRRLRGVWNAAADGHPQAVVVTGEAGIGKSRLVAELARMVTAEGATVVRARAYQAEGRFAWAPVIKWLRADAVRGRLGKLPTVWLTELVRLLPELRLDHPDLPDPAEPAHAEQRAYLFRAVAEAIGCADEPLLLVLDDLQWCDDDSLELVHFVLRNRAGARLLVAGTARFGQLAGEAPLPVLLESLRHDGLVAEMALDRLDEAATVELGCRLAGRDLDAETEGALYRETQGNPHFVVEAVRVWLTSGRPGIAATVQALLQRRMNHLSPAARAIAEVAAVSGQDFSPELLATADSATEDELVEALDELWRHHIIKEHGAGYDFDHDRLRDVAYGMISPARRRRLHRTVARAFEHLHGQDPGPVSARLAVHYEQAGQLYEAAEAHHRAAEHALHLLALDDALAEVRRALTLLEELPPGPDRDELELRIRMVETVPTVIRSGYADPATERSYERVLVLARDLGRPSPAPALRGLASAALAACRLRRARELGEQLLAAGAEDPAVLVEAHYVLGVTAHWLGEFKEARDHLAAAVERCRAGLGIVHVARFAQDPEAICHSRLGWTLWCLGQPDQALFNAMEAWALSRRQEHPLTSAYVGWSTACFAVEAGELELLRETVAASTAAWTVNPLFSALCPPLFGGWIEVAEGNPEGLERLREAVAVTRRHTHALHHALALVLLARGSVAHGRPHEASTPVAQARSWAEQRSQHYFAAVVHHLEGEVAAALGDPVTAASAFEQAIDAAAAQGFRPAELRAACALVRQRRDPDARLRLKTVYDAFAEGHDRADLRAAADLLAAAPR